MNLLEKYLEYSQEFCDAPAIYHQSVLYSIVGLLIERKRYLHYGNYQIYPNLWTILLGQSARYRKSTTINIGLNILNRLDSLIQYPSEFSHEKIIEVLQERPKGVFVYQEFMSLLSLLSRDYMIGTKSLLTELFDSPDIYQRKTKTIDVVIEKPCIGILSATTMEWLKLKLTENDLLAGFMPRFFFVPATSKPETMYFPPKPDKEKKYHIEEDLLMIQQAEPFEYNLTDDSKDLFINYCRESDVILDKHENPVASVLFNRHSNYLLKHAIIIQAMKDINCNMILPEAMMEAITYCNCCFKSMLECLFELSFGKEEGKISKVLKCIKDAKENGITKSKLLTGTKLQTNILDPIIKTLIDSEQITSQSKRMPNADKPTLIYYYKKENK